MMLGWSVNSSSCCLLASIGYGGYGVVGVEISIQSLEEPVSKHEKFG